VCLRSHPFEWLKGIKIRNLYPSRSDALETHFKECDNDEGNPLGLECSFIAGRGKLENSLEAPLFVELGKNANKLMRITQSHNQISTQYKVFAIKLNWRKSNLM
jgi:hypothetical protein